MVNGSLYGVFVAEERIGHHFVKEWFPGNSDGDLFKGGSTAETNTSNPNWTRLDQFWAAATPAQLTAIVDLSPSLLSWAAEAMLNDADGFYGGDHNFYIYDEGATKGYAFFPDDLDSSLDYLGDSTTDPIYWWSARHDVKDVLQPYRIVIGDDALRAQYIAALGTQLHNWNVPQIQSWIDTAAAQIAPAVEADPHKPSTTTAAAFQAAVTLERSGIQARADYVSSWLACRASGAGDDRDGDGVVWCLDCRDDDATIHPGAPRSAATASTRTVTACSTKAARSVARFFHFWLIPAGRTAVRAGSATLHHNYGPPATSGEGATVLPMAPPVLVEEALMTHRLSLRILMTSLWIGGAACSSSTGGASGEGGNQSTGSGGTSSSGSGGTSTTGSGGTSPAGRAERRAPEARCDGRRQRSRRRHADGRHDGNGGRFGGGRKVGVGRLHRAAA